MSQNGKVLLKCDVILNGVKGLNVQIDVLKFLHFVLDDKMLEPFVLR